MINPLKNLLLIIPFLWGHSQAIAMGRIQVLEQLKTLKQDNYAKLSQLDQRLQRLLKDQKVLELKQASTNNSPFDQNFKAFESELEVIITQRKEHLLRQSFLDRLLFQMDNHYQGKNLRNFLHHKLMKMSLIEITSSREKAPLWRFLSYLSLAVKNLPENNENLLSFVEDYMKFSSISNPVRPEQFLNFRHYTNGYSSTSATPMDAAVVGDIVEKKLLQLEKKNVAIKQIHLKQAHKNSKKYQALQPALAAKQKNNLILKDQVTLKELSNMEFHYHFGVKKNFR